MEIITELDGYQAALSQINMNESVMPYVNGRLVSEKAYNKVQKILNCPEMIASHKYLYNLDLDQLTEDEECKIDQLYKLGCDRGFIIDDLTKYDEPTEQSVAPVEQNKVEFKADIPCWTVIYSATDKNGQIKTGEAYSNAISSDAAKADVNSKLSQIGYGNISILAIEQCETPIAKEDNVIANNTVLPEADDEDTDSSDDGDVEDDTSDEESSDDEIDTDDSSDVDSSDDAEDSSDDEGDSDEGDSDEDDADTDDSDDEDSGEDSEDDSDDDSDEDDDEDSDDEDSDDEDSDDEKEELDSNQKAELKDKYRRVFKNTLVKCKFDTSFNDLTLEQKVKFFTALSKAWTKNEPNEFMTDKEIEQLNNVVVKEND